MATLPVNAGALPGGFCPSTYQEILNAFSAAQSVTFTSGSGVTVVAQASTPTDTTVVWLQLDSLGRPVRFYYFAAGAWLSLHPMVPGATMIWTTTLPTLTSFDGGDANPVSPVSGPMWEVVTAFQARMPLGVGTLPSGLAVAVGDTGGAEDVTLTETQLPAHGHELWVGSSDGNAAGIREAIQTVNSPHSGTSASYELNEPSTTNNNYVNDTGGDASHTNMPPWLGVYLLRRTSRLYYVI